MDNKNEAHHSFEVHRSEPVLRGFFEVDKLALSHALHDGGMTPVLERFVLRRPDAVCAVIYHRERDAFLFVRQFRVGSFEQDDAWMTELAAGLIDDGESPDQAMRREVGEELGYIPDTLEFLQKIYSSPGILTERVYIYFAEVDETMRIGPGGGSASEHEDIEVISVMRKNVASFVASAAFLDAKSLLGMYLVRDKWDRD